MKKLIYTGVFSLLVLGFVACSEAEDEALYSEDEIKMEDNALTTKKTEELNKSLQLQQDAEKLDTELNEYIESL